MRRHVRDASEYFQGLPAFSRHCSMQACLHLVGIAKALQHALPKARYIWCVTKVDPSEGCFGCHKTHFLVKNAFSWKPKKLTQSTVRIGDVSLQNSKKHPQCASEVSGENSCKISSLKVWNKPPLAPVPFRACFGIMGRHFEGMAAFSRHCGIKACLRYAGITKALS